MSNDVTPINIDIPIKIVQHYFQTAFQAEYLSGLKYFKPSLETLFDSRLVPLFIRVPSNIPSLEHCEIED